MADGSTTLLLGIPVPSTDPVFLTFIGIHIVFGIVATIAGAMAMLMKKGRGRHSRFGTLYFWTLTGVCITMGILFGMRWRENYHLFILGTLAFAALYLGRRFAGRYDLLGLRFHIGGMGASYVLMLTAFYVDNGKNLPLWKELPQVAFWIVPAIPGIPLILRAMLRHPLISRRVEPPAMPSK
jgi:hypothetical protein